MGHVAGAASHVLDRLSQPPGGRVPMAGVLDDIPTWCPAHHFWGRDTLSIDLCSFLFLMRSSLDIRRSNVAIENKDQEPETASATLADGMHFVGNIEGFRIDLDAEES